MGGFKTSLACAVLVLTSVPVLAQHGKREAPPQPPPKQQQSQPQSNPPANNFVRPQYPQGGGKMRGPGPHAGDWLRHYGGMPPAQQQKELENDPTFKRLPPERQEKLKERLNNYNQMSPEQKQKVLNRMEMWEHLTPDQKQRAQTMFQQFRQMDPQSRQRVTFALRKLKDMTPDERQRVYSSDQFKNNFNGEEQNLIKGMAEIGPADSEPADNPDHR